MRIMFDLYDKGIRGDSVLFRVLPVFSNITYENSLFFLRQQMIRIYMI